MRKRVDFTLSDRWIKQADAVLMQTYARFPLVLTRGVGATVYDINGKAYLDFVGGIAVNSLGHCDTQHVAAIVQQAKALLHVSNLYYHIPQITLAQRLIAHFPGKVFFCNSGAEANEAAIKLARKFARDSQVIKRPDRFEIIAMQGAFHGRTLATLAAAGRRQHQKGFEPMPRGFTQVPFDDCGAIESAITPKTIAVFLEPIQGEGGVRVPSPGYLSAVRRLCDRHGLLMILDEVQTGMGRTGRLFAYQHEGIVPDIITLAKGLGGGVPIGAMLATSRVAESFTPGTHASTFGGNPLVCAAAVSVVERLAKPAFLSRVKKMGDYLQKRLMQLKTRYRLIREVRGVGLMVAVDLERPVASDLVKRGYETGLLLNKTSNDTLRLIPPLTIQRIEIDAMIDRLEEILQGQSDITLEAPPQAAP